MLRWCAVRSPRASEVRAGSSRALFSLSAGDSRGLSRPRLSILCRPRCPSTSPPLHATSPIAGPVRRIWNGSQVRAESHLSLSAPCGQRDGSGNTGPLSAFLQGGEVTVLMLHTSRPKPCWSCLTAHAAFECPSGYPLSATAGSGVTKGSFCVLMSHAFVHSRCAFCHCDTRSF